MLITFGVNMSSSIWHAVIRSDQVKGLNTASFHAVRYCASGCFVNQPGVYSTGTALARISGYERFLEYKAAADKPTVRRTTQMDPITTSLTIFQVVRTIAQASAALYEYIASVCDADSSCQSLLDEFSSISGVLATVMGIQDDATLPTPLRSALSKLMSTDGPLARLQEDLMNILLSDPKSRKMGAKAKVIWPFKEKKATIIIQRLKQYYVDITAIVAVHSLNILKGVHHMTQNLVENSDSQKLHEKAEERQKLLQWMAPVPCAEKHDICSLQRNADTGRWIFETPQYRDWYEAEFASLWLKGQAGSGKTILASTVIDEIRRAEKRQTLAYFYCDFRVGRTTNSAAVLRSLIVQLLGQSQEDWINIFPELVRKKSNAEGCPTDLGFLREHLVVAAKLVPRPVLVIDALDECKEHRSLLKHLVDLAENAQLRLFVTSRIQHDIVNPFPCISLMDNAKRIQEDICAHIKNQLKAHERLSCLPEELRAVILEKLSEKANGMFRWVQCQLDTIIGLKRPDSIRKAIDDLPAGLDETYDRIICAIEDGGKDDGPIAQRCLLWLAGAFIPLTLAQLDEAIMIETGQSSLNHDKGVIKPMDIVVACRSLVVYNEMTDIVALSHYSVKEYLTGQHPKIEGYQFSVSNMHADICQLAIAYLLCDFEERKVSGVNCIEGRKAFARVAGGRDGYPLLSYAVHALKHLRYISIEDPRVMECLSQLHSQLGQNPEKWSLIADTIANNNDRFWRRKKSSLTNSHWLKVTSPSLLFIPLQLGQPWTVEYLAKQQADLLDMDIAPGWGSPLIFAISLKHDSLGVFNRLGVDFNKPSSVKNDLYSLTNVRSGSYAPISWAVAIAEKDAINFLLSQSTLKLPDDILHTAVACVKPSHEVVGKLRERGADIHFTVKGSTPLHVLLSRKRARSGDFFTRLFMRSDASSQDWLPIVKELAEPSCDLSVQDWTARTVLQIALDKGLSNIVEYLLEKNAPLSANAALNSDLWTWAKDKKWFPSVQAAADAADKPSTRIRSGKVFITPGESKVIGFNHVDFNRIRTVVVSVVINDKGKNISNASKDMGTSIRLVAGLSRHVLSLQDKIKGRPRFKQKGPEYPTALEFSLSWEDHQSVSSRLFDRRQGDEVTTRLEELTKSDDSIGNSLFLRVSMSDGRQHSLIGDMKNTSFLDPNPVDGRRAHPVGVECVIDIYRFPSEDPSQH